MLDMWYSPFVMTGSGVRITLAAPLHNTFANALLRREANARELLNRLGEALNQAFGTVITARLQVHFIIERQSNQRAQQLICSGLAPSRPKRFFIAT